jgi:hypothetical protein
MVSKTIVGGSKPSIRAKYFEVSSFCFIFVENFKTFNYDKKNDHTGFGLPICLLARSKNGNPH